MTDGARPPTTMTMMTITSCRPLRYIEHLTSLSHMVHAPLPSRWFTFKLLRSLLFSADKATSAAVDGQGRLRRPVCTRGRPWLAPGRPEEVGPCKQVALAAVLRCRRRPGGLKLGRGRSTLRQRWWYTRLWLWWLRAVGMRRPWSFTIASKAAPCSRAQSEGEARDWQRE